MNSIVRFAASLAAGAAAMYFFDPATGRRRRAQARDRTAAACGDADRYVRGKCNHVAGRLQGVVAETRSRLASHPIDDARLYERIRARLGHLMEHAGAIEVEVRNGEVKLSGEVSEAEAQSVPRALGRMPGVTAVESALRVSAPSADDSQAPEPDDAQSGSRDPAAPAGQAGVGPTPSL